ncbi:hypothetical protein BdWA1_001446 [Babesia duncani]|uniref:Uncharacterized protein n=1 Tax=Babesia duncani TaxID=323732 RepID=A0AAD9UQT4_9APIC|nr:hypothetical protein BdWA1_001446 [Babesia duncani]
MFLPLTFLISFTSAVLSNTKRPVIDTPEDFLIFPNKLIKETNECLPTNEENEVPKANTKPEPLEPEHMEEAKNPIPEDVLKEMVQENDKLPKELPSQEIPNMDTRGENYNQNVVESSKIFEEANNQSESETKPAAASEQEQSIPDIQNNTNRIRELKAARSSFL